MVLRRPLLRRQATLAVVLAHMRGIAFFTALAFVVCVGSAGSTNASDIVQPRWRGSIALLATRSGLTQHLYLSAVPSSSTVMATVYAYPLANGLPASLPDASLQTSLFNVLGLAIGPDNDLYVAGTKLYRSKEESWVAVWPQGSRGKQRPIRNLKTPGYGGVAVDSNGFLFAYSSIYAPGATGNAKPISTLKAPKFVRYDFGSVAVDGENEVLLDDGSRALEYANPVSEPVRIADSCWKPRYLKSFSATIGLDGTEYVAINAYGNLPGKILVFPKNAKGCHPIRKITTTDQPLQTITTVLATGRYLYALDYGGSLVVLDPTKGTQAPVQRVGTARWPWGLAIGP